MKPLLLLLCFATVLSARASFTPSAADTVRPRYKPSRADIEQDVRQLNTSGAILTIGGAGMLTTGIFLLNNAAEHDEWDTPNSNIIGGVILLAAGTICMLASIPLFIVAKHKKRKYLRGGLALGSETVDHIQGTRIAQVRYPTVGFRLRF